MLIYVEFGPLLAPFWSLLAPFGTLLAAFGSLLAPTRYLLVPLAPFWHPFGNILVVVLRFYPFWSLFIHFDRFRFHLARILDPKWRVLAANPARAPQINFSPTSTVGTQPFLGPGREYCRRQLKSPQNRYFGLKWSIFHGFSCLFGLHFSWFLSFLPKHRKIKKPGISYGKTRFFKV